MFVHPAQRVAKSNHGTNESNAVKSLAVSPNGSLSRGTSYTSGVTTADLATAIAVPPFGSKERIPSLASCPLEAAEKPASKLYLRTQNTPKRQVSSVIRDWER